MNSKPAFQVIRDRLPDSIESAAVELEFDRFQVLDWILIKPVEKFLVGICWLVFLGHNL
jgi:hypothetical protein